MTESSLLQRGSNVSATRFNVTRSCFQLINDFFFVEIRPKLGLVYQGLLP